MRFAGLVFDLDALTLARESGETIRLTRASWRFSNVDGAPILNGIMVVIKAAEMAVKLERLGFPAASRHLQSDFALPSPQARHEFLSYR